MLHTFPCAAGIDERQAVVTAVSDSADHCPFSKFPVLANDGRRTARAGLGTAVEMFQERAD
jgi:hypothetical protein